MSALGELERLPDWDQFAVRRCTHIVLCFPLDGSASQEATSEHLQSALDRLVEQAPQLGGTLFLGEGTDATHVFLHKSPGKVALQVFHVESKDHANMYQNFKERYFSNSYLELMKVDNATHRLLDSKVGFPALQVRLFYIPGGMYLWVHLHHSLGDGHCLGMVIDSFAAQTQGRALACPNQINLRFPNNRSDERTVEQLLQACPEYVQLPSPFGPTQPITTWSGEENWTHECIGNIFFLTKEALESLRGQVREHMDSATSHHQPSIFTCLAVLIWVHVTAARLKGEAWATPENRLCDGKLFIPVDWSRRCFPDATADYFGNSAATLAVRVPVAELEEAHGNMHAFARLVQKVMASIQSVNQEWVEDRNALFKKMADPRFLGIDHDPGLQQELHVNSWRHFGADGCWTIPGVPTHRPDGLLNPRDRWRPASVIILPDRAASGTYRLLASLTVAATTALREDTKWMSWVDQVVACP
ncbi:hypothetical protein GQ53DRAFT_891367 [Thozetella sp. PMI_491]|nr:hypothetical protein GQ53DRAFT_891367 [Thozetella sp. PMI_491]